MDPDTLEEIHGILPRPPFPRRTLRIVGEDGHHITTNAWEKLLRQYGPPENALESRIIDELESLAPIAYVAHRQGHVLCTSYSFIAKNSEKTLWFLPNAYGGITIMLPEEHL